MIHIKDKRNNYNFLYFGIINISITIIYIFGFSFNLLPMSYTDTSQQIEQPTNKYETYNHKRPDNNNRKGTTK